MDNTPTLGAEAVAALARHGSYRLAAAALGIATSTFQNRVSAERARAFRGQIGGPPIPSIATPPAGFEVVENSGRYNGDGALTGQSVKTRRAAGAEYDVPAGHVIKGESALLDPDGRLLARWVKTREGAGEAWADALRRAFAEYDGAAPAIVTPAGCDDDLLTVYPVPDLHFGAYSWCSETGADYDTEIATKIARDSMAALVAQSRPSASAVLLILGDFFHANDQKNATPGSGHQLDVDSRWPLVYRAGAELAVSMVDMIASKHERVEVVVLPGNHDPDAAVTLTVALSMFYASNDRIAVSMKPGVFWYRRFGLNLFGAHHGHTVKMERMGMVMASDRSRDWGQTEHRIIFTGHIHHESAKEFPGVRVESMQSPAARDAWNANSGYRSGRSLQAVTFHNDAGEVGRHRVNIANRKRNEVLN